MKQQLRPLAFAGILLASACGTETDPGLASTPVNRPDASRCAVSAWPSYMKDAIKIDAHARGSERPRLLGIVVLQMPDAVTLEIKPQPPLPALPEDGTLIDLGTVQVKLTSACHQATPSGASYYVLHPNMTNSQLVPAS